MKLESLKSERFKKLQKEELDKVMGGYEAPASDVTVTWTKAENKTDDDCSDCDD
ncbi:hypothetical protein [Sinomicrobium weinanense]|uniref:Uncharacterized protein n=1 Tax=Sinomicrobium weinanense TaxID=2842200 RepID=A0A926JVR2_9FLAO|nr:hypothetical protein [Sinomicrobium weinanense]MBC9798463.1 hypothetical protein [Sinomicrobium weinanense]MBU3126004.1 hypothetical protein [Sinomicrobium weinanense]